MISMPSSEAAKNAKAKHYQTHKDESSQTNCGSITKLIVLDVLRYHEMKKQGEDIMNIIVSII